MIKYIDDVFDEKYLCSQLKKAELINLRTGNLFDFNHNEFAWYLSKDISIEQVEASKNGARMFGVRVTDKTVHTPQFVHSVVINFRDRPKGDTIVNSPTYEFLVPLIEELVTKYFPEYKHYIIDRMKINMLLKNPKVTSKNFYNVPHIDEEKKHISIILYLSDSDGDTVFFKERAEDESEKQLTELTEIARIKPKFNRCVVSDGHYHTSSNPFESDFRVILNTVLIHPDEALTDSNK